jgi:hypothetical protein
MHIIYILEGYMYMLQHIFIKWIRKKLDNSTTGLTQQERDKISHHFDRTANQTSPQQMLRKISRVVVLINYVIISLLIFTLSNAYSNGSFLPA